MITPRRMTPEAAAAAAIAADFLTARRARHGDLRMEMTDPTPDPTPDQAAQPNADQATEPADTTDWKAEARKWEQRAKENKAAAAEVEKARKAAMSESERAVAEAEERGRMAAVASYGERLARTEFVAEAAKRNPGFDAAAVLDDLNLARYIGEDGEPDSKAITAAVGRLIPEGGSAAPQPPSFDGGARRTAPVAADMNTFIRQAAGRA